MVAKLHDICGAGIAGIAGAFIGGTLAGLGGVQFYGLLGSFEFAIIGAVLVLFVWHRMRA